MPSGQADMAPEADDSSVLQFLLDNPDADAPEADIEEDEELSDDPSDEEDKSEDDEVDPDDEEAKAASEAAKSQTSDLKFKVPVKGEDGTETTVEVDQKELIAGYQRQADYTRKTMALADKEREVTQAVSTKLAQGQEQLVEQAQLAHAAIQQIAGILTPQQMAQLAQSDPAAWVQEQQRQAHINGVLQQLQGMTQQQKDQIAKQRDESLQQQKVRAWDVLTKEGLDKPKLQKTFESVIKHYGKFGESAERLSHLYDPAVVLMMKDAVAYQELLAKKEATTKVVKTAPKMPAQRQSVPQDERKSKQLNDRFRTGRAKLGDLAKIIEQMS